MSSGTFVLPGDEISPSAISSSLNTSAPLKLGPGLIHIPPSTIKPVVAGNLCVNAAKNAIWIEGYDGRVSSPSYTTSASPKISNTCLIVYPHHRRSCHSTSPPFDRRFLPLRNNAPRHSREPWPPRLRGRHQEVTATPNAQYACLRPSKLRQQIHGARAGVRAPLDRQG